jgi:hypothetical protein
VYNLRGDGDNIPAGVFRLASSAVYLLVSFSADCCNVPVVFLTDSVVFCRKLRDQKLYAGDMPLKRLLESIEAVLDIS